MNSKNKNQISDSLDSFKYSTQPRNTIGTGKKGNKPGELYRPHSVCYDNINCLIIVTDNGNNRIQLFDAHTLEYHSMFGGSEEFGPFSNSSGICIQPFTHNLLVCDRIQNHVQSFNQSINQLSSTISFSYGIKGCANNENEKIDILKHPRSICCDEKGHIIVRSTWENIKIEEFNECGQFLSYFVSGPNSSSIFLKSSFTNGVHLNKEYRQLFVGDYGKVSIWSHDSSSKPELISSIPLKSNCQSICTNPFNHQIVIGSYLNVCVFDNRNYKLIQTLGEDCTDKFGCVSGLCVNEDDGSLIVAKCWNDSVQLF